MNRLRPLALIVLDGWGLSDSRVGNAVALAATPNFDLLWASWPHATLLTHGPHVGLREGQMGNSNVGHLNLGAGRIVYQDLTRIDRAIADGSLAASPVLQTALQQTPRGAAVHLIGLFSDGGVHSHLEHLLALWRVVDAYPQLRVVLHCFLDGRDVGPTTAGTFFDRLEAERGPDGLEAIASIIGRYWAMDRDRRWERTRRAYEAIVLGQGQTADDARSALAAAYERGETDEFVRPTVIARGGKPVAPVGADDLIIFFNFRADRARQLTQALIDPGFDAFARPLRMRSDRIVTMTKYSDALDVAALLPPDRVERPFGQIVAEAGLKQLRIAETEKYAHVTYFFDGGEERAEPGEKRILVPSPSVATYDLQPEMSAPEVTARVLAELQRDEHDVIVLNFANPDMVGHTGDLDAAIKACSVVDHCLGQVVDALLTRGGGALVCADHGNAEMMIDPTTGGPHTAHTTNPVPVILISEQHRQVQLRDGILADVAPTLCELLGLPVPPEMDRPSLIVNGVRS